uniref:Peptide methionine sulfoxide reductase B5 n=2 Tax=Lygus hesperus TaxID=30085 RepID=A0A0A9Y5Y0_LYGHE
MLQRFARITIKMGLQYRTTFSTMGGENWNKLTREEEQVIVHKGTEPPFSGKYLKWKEDGTFVCRRCQTQLFTSKSKFDSHCGWPAFDDAIPGAVKEVQDTRRPDAVEILCSSCGGHLGHVFRGERLTPANTRYCVNSLSIDFTDSKS